MAISFPLSLPSTVGIASISIATESVVALSPSPFTFSNQVQVYDGQRWRASVSLPNMVRADAEPWITFLTKLNGQEGTFLLGDPTATAPQGSGSGTPLVNGASQTGQELVTDGWTPSATSVLKEGDYIQLGSRLYKSLIDVDADGSGNATIDIWPALRESPADNTALVLNSTKGLFRLASNQQPIVAANEAKVYSLSFSAIEAV